MVWYGLGMRRYRYLSHVIMASDPRPRYVMDERTSPYHNSLIELYCSPSDWIITKWISNDVLKVNLILLVDGHRLVQVRLNNNHAIEWSAEDIYLIVEGGWMAHISS